MRSDNHLDKSLRESESWKQDPVTGKKGKDVARYRAPNRDRVPMSLSGKERNHLFISDAGKSFSDISSVSGADSISDGRSFAILDFDRDGWQDMILANANSPVLQLFRNQAGELATEPRYEVKNELKNTNGKFVAVGCVGGNRSERPSSSFSNRDGIGAKIRVEMADKSLTSEYTCGEGLAAQNSSTKLFGLGTASTARSIEITWPTGLVQRAENVDAGQLVTFYENADETKSQSGVERTEYVLSSLSTKGETAVQPRHLKGIEFKYGDNASAKLNLYTSMATWCPSCKKHLPELQQLRSRFDETLLSMTGVPVDFGDSVDKLNQYVLENKPPYELSFDWTTAQRLRFHKIGVSKTRQKVLPTTIIANSRGDVVEIMAGIPSVSDIIRLLAE